MANHSFLVITHGEFGIEIIRSVEMVMGPQEDLVGLALRPGDSVEDLRSQAVEIAEKNTKEGKETIVLCDILGGSPSNVGLFLLSKEGVNHVVTGVNMPMLISLISSYETAEDTKALLASAKEDSVSGVKLIDMEFIKRK